MRAFTTATLLGLLMTGCGGGSSTPPPDAGLPDDITPLSAKISREASRLRDAQSCADVKSYVATAMAQGFLESPYCFQCGGLIFTPTAIDAEAPPTSPDQVSDTTNQVAGVDEADMIKADAQGNLFIAHDDELIIADAYPPTQLSELARLTLNGYVTGLFLIEDQQRVVAVTSTVLNPTLVFTNDAFAPPRADIGSEIVFIDISDPALPRVTDKLWVAGYAQSQRRIDGRIHLVIGNQIDVPASLHDDAEFGALLTAYAEAKNSGDEGLTGRLADQVREHVTRAVVTTPIDRFVPRAARASGGDYASFDALACEDIYRPEVAVNLGLTTLLSVDADGGNIDAVAAITTVTEVYTSRDNVYLTQSSNHWWWDPQQADETAIHQFSIATGSPRFVASGVVDGHVHDRFSLDEFDGSLRVATTERVWDDQTERALATNHLMVLQDRADGTLAQVGAVRNFIRDEQIFSARFMGARGYVVTFRQIDPLFSFDLSDPLAPRLGGEVEIPGFSSYIHPYDADHLITIGRGGDATGADNTVKLQMFDVRTLDDPRLLHEYTADIDGIVPAFSWSVAQYDPHAFTFFAPESLLSVPLSMVDQEARRSFNGFLAMHVDRTTGFTERSRVDHNDLASLAFCGGDNDDPALCDSGTFLWYLTPLRTVVMTDPAGDIFLYTLSDVGLKATAVDDAAQTLGMLLL